MGSLPFGIINRMDRLGVPDRDPVRQREEPRDIGGKDAQRVYRVVASQRLQVFVQDELVHGVV